MSAIPGLAIDSSAKGVCDSTTTARFIGTFSAPGRLAPHHLKNFRLRRRCRSKRESARSRAALINLSGFIVTLPLRSRAVEGLLSPAYWQAQCGKADFISIIMTFHGTVAVD
jgi:hypothetical protein